MLNNFLLFLIALSAIICHKQDRTAVIVFSICTVLFAWIGAKIDDAFALFYYVGAAAVDLLIIFSLSKIAHPTRRIVDLQTVCKRFIYVNLLGWLAYMLYFSPVVYNSICALLYLWTLFVILKGKNKNVLGDNAMDGGHTGFYSGHHPGGFAMQTNKKASRN